MQKYKVTQKQLKTRSSTYYRALNTQTNQKVLIKKLNKGRSWQQILSDKFINLLKLQKYSWAPKIIQIVKDQDRHYIIFENLENNLPDLMSKDKSPAMIATVAKKISQILFELKNEGILSPAIKPEYFFVNKNEIKLTHIPQGEQLDLVNASPERVNNKQITDKSSVFQLACLMVQGVTGKPLIQAANKKQYEQILNKLFTLSKDQQNSESIRAILRSVTSDFEFIQAIEAMLNPDPSKRPNIETSSNTLKRFSTSDSLSPNPQNNKLLFLSTLEKIDSNKINILRKCNQISTKFLDDDYSELAQMSRIVSETQVLPPEQNATDNAVFSKIKQQKRSMIMQHPIVSPKNRQKGTETLPKLYNKRQQYTNYALYKHQNLGVQSDQMASQKFGDQKFTNI